MTVIGRFQRLTALSKNSLQFRKTRVNVFFPLLIGSEYRAGAEPPVDQKKVRIIFYSTPIAPCAQLRPGHHTPQSINTPSRRPHMRQGSRTRGTRPPRTGRCGTAGAAARPSSAPHARAPAPLVAGHSGGAGHGGRAGTPRDGGAAGRHVISAAVARVPERDCHGQHQVLPV